MGGLAHQRVELVQGFALRQCADGKEASPNFVLQSMRANFKCEIRNGMAPALARIAMEGRPAHQVPPCQIEGGRLREGEL